jgi:hypothetical protein
MSVTDAPVVAGEAGPDVVGTGYGPVADSLVERLQAEFAGDPQAIRREVEALLAAFADARVQAFVPILVEKQLRDTYRRANGIGVRSRT